MYGIFTNIYPKNHPNVGNYTIHGVYVYWKIVMNPLIRIRHCKDSPEMG